MPFADDVRAGLSARPKTLPAKYFYDDLGSLLFEAITLLPEYYLTRAETEIFRAHSQAIIDLVQPARFVELGSGSALKVGGDIRNISGATLSSLHITEGVKRILANYGSRAR